MSSFSGDQNNHSDDVPDALLAGLRKLYEPPESVSESLDDGIRQQARRQLLSHTSGVSRGDFSRTDFSQTRRPWRVAAVLLAMLVPLALLWESATRPGLDFDGNRRVDIGDAFVMARWFKQGGGGSQRADVNGDGSFDQRDIDEVARRAVRLSG